MRYGIFGCIACKVAFVVEFMAISRPGRTHVIVLRLRVNREEHIIDLSLCVGQEEYV